MKKRLYDTRSSPSGRGKWNSLHRTQCAMRRCCWRTAFGRPVEPEVYSTKTSASRLPVRVKASRGLVESNLTYVSYRYVVLYIK